MGKSQNLAPLCKHSRLGIIPGANNPWKVLKWAKKVKIWHPCANIPGWERIKPYLDKKVNLDPCANRLKIAKSGGSLTLCK
jgi:hypothetical protein